jgi:lipoprotein-anchoring transpeptidase ErfK/SrfK
MNRRRLGCGLLAMLALGMALDAEAARRSPRCGNLLAFQVLLDRQGFSPGVIDGKSGANLKRALSAMQGAKRLAETGQPDCDSWRALGGDTAPPPTTEYTVTDADMQGPFTDDIPDDLVDQARLPSLGYRSVVEMLAERFHTSPAFLRTLNKTAAFDAGAHVTVPAVVPFDAATKPARETAAPDVTITVSRDGSLRAADAAGSLMFFAPASSGSVHDPLPAGTWKVTSVNWLPRFHYNPDLFWDAKTTDEKATIKPGPNNPVGVVWIGLDREHYGLHGTPEPASVGYTQSHGCVRLTNWDAARVASLVQPGTPVIFE